MPNGWLRTLFSLESEGLRKVCSPSASSWSVGVALTSGGIDSVVANARVDTASFTDLLVAFGAEVDRGCVAIFLCAHLKPGVGVFFDAICEPADTIGR